MILIRKFYVSFLLLQSFCTFEIDDLSKIKSCGDFSVDEKSKDLVQPQTKSCKYTLKSENGSAIKIKLHGLGDSYRNGLTI